jgi:hypothetical protein
MVRNLFLPTFARWLEKTNPILSFNAQKMFGRRTGLPLKQNHEQDEQRTAQSD